MKIHIFKDEILLDEAGYMVIPPPTNEIDKWKIIGLKCKSCGLTLENGVEFDFQCDSKKCPIKAMPLVLEKE